MRYCQIPTKYFDARGFEFSAIPIQLPALRLVLLPNCAYAAWALMSGQSKITLKRSMKYSLGARAAFIMMLSKINLAKYLSRADTHKSQIQHNEKKEKVRSPKGKLQNRDFSYLFDLIGHEWRERDFRIFFLAVLVGFGPPTITSRWVCGYVLPHLLWLTQAHFNLCAPGSLRSEFWPSRSPSQTW